MKKSNNKKSEVADEQKYAHPFYVLDRDNEKFNTCVNMDVNFYGSMYMLMQKFAGLQALVSDKSIPVTQKVNMMAGAFNEDEINHYVTITSTLLNAIAKNLADQNFIELHTEDEIRAKIDEMTKQAEEEIKTQMEKLPTE